MQWKCKLLNTLDLPHLLIRNVAGNIIVCMHNCHTILHCPSVAHMHSHLSVHVYIHKQSHK